MLKKNLALLLAAFICCSCSTRPTVAPTKTNSFRTVTDEPQATERLITPSPTINMTSTPTIGIKNTMSLDVTLEMTPHPCPDSWFNASRSPTPPIFLLIYVEGRLYMAYRYDLPPDQSLYDLSPGPAKSYTVTYSQDQKLIAYFLPNEDTSNAEIWISDLPLCSPTLIFEDHDSRIGNPKSYTYFQWGPGDKSIILKSDENEFPMFVYSLYNHEVEFWQGVCDDIVHLDKTNEIVVGCSHDGKYSYLHPSGMISTVATNPKLDGNPVVAWSFSNGGDAAYITSTNEVYLLRGNGQKTKLPLEGYALINIPFGLDPLHWSANGERLLVLAYDPLENRCPRDLACWFVVDGESGEIVWWLKPETIDEEIYWDEINTMFPAALSPDGEQLAIQYYKVGMLTSIIQISSDKVLIQDNVFSDQMAWPPY
jgi:hypothetical protein